MTLPPILSSTPMPPQRPDRPDAPRPMFSALAIASSGMSAQRMRMEVVAQNLANAETTHTAQGGPYQRKVVNLEAILPQDGSASAMGATNAANGAAASSSSTVVDPNGVTTTSSAATTAAPSAANAPTGQQANSPTGQQANSPADAGVIGGVRVASVGEDKTQGALVYDPGHPDADKNGYVRMPNVNITDEMVDLMNARRLYEANATVFQVARTMLHKALDI